MARISAPTREQLTLRRRQLRSRRRNTLMQGSWRITATFSLLAGLVVAIRQPYWRLERPNQIQIEGNQLLSDDQVRARLPFQLPIDLWHIQPQAIEQALLQSGSETADGIPGEQSPLKAVYVQRQLIPPGLVIQVEERRPIARSIVRGITGLVDLDGTWLSLRYYPELANSAKLPKLQLIGWGDHSPQEWSKVLRGLQSSTVAIQTINWQTSEGIVLTTEIGRVYLGSLSTHLPEQVLALDQMQNLKRYCRCDPKDIDHIDLSSPTVPTVQWTARASQKRLTDPP